MVLRMIKMVSQFFWAKWQQQQQLQNSRHSMFFQERLVKTGMQNVKYDNTVQGMQKMYAKLW